MESLFPFETEIFNFIGNIQQVILVLVSELSLPSFRNVAVLFCYLDLYVILKKKKSAFSLTCPTGGLKSRNYLGFFMKSVNKQLYYNHSQTLLTLSKCVSFLILKNNHLPSLNVYGEMVFKRLKDRKRWVMTTSWW